MKKAAVAAAVVIACVVVLLMSAFGAMSAQSAAACAQNELTVGDTPGSTYAGPLDRVFPAHYLDEPRGKVQLTPHQVRAIFASVGLPPKIFELIAKGESRYYPGVVQRDPGNGMVGVGLLQITPNAWAPTSEARAAMERLGGLTAMRNPVQNAKMGKWLYEHATSKVPNTAGFPWFGTEWLKDYKGDLTPPTQTVALEDGVGEAQCQPVADEAGGPVEGSPKAVIDNVVLPLARQCGMVTGRTPEMVEAANAVHGPTNSGGLSDHQGPPSERWAADMSDGQAPTPGMDCLATALAKRFHLAPLNLETSGAGGSTQDSRGTMPGYRFQLIYRSYLGGNHDNHVHFGVAAVAGPVQT